MIGGWDIWASENRTDWIIKLYCKLIFRIQLVV